MLPNPLARPLILTRVESLTEVPDDYHRPGAQAFRGRAQAQVDRIPRSLVELIRLDDRTIKVQMICARFGGVPGAIRWDLEWISGERLLPELQ